MNLLKLYFDKTAKIKLWYGKQKEISVLSILEGFMSERILEGESWRKNELVQVQQKVDESEKLLKYLKKLR